MNNYAKGAEKERKLLHELEAKGYRCVRSAASMGDHAIDLVAVGASEIRLIQVKSTKRRIVSTEAVENAYKKDVEALRGIDHTSNVVFKYLYLWTHRKGWRVYWILRDRLCEMKDDELYNYT